MSELHNHLKTARRVILSNKTVIVIGQAPGRGPGQIYGNTAKGTWKHLSDMFGIPYENLDSVIGRFNLCPRYTGKNGKGDAFDLNLGKVLAGVITCYLLNRRRPVTVILLGRNVAKCFGVKSDFAKLQTYGDKVKVAVIPHPSMVNRFWNDERNVKKIQRFLKKTIA